MMAAIDHVARGLSWRLGRSYARTLFRIARVRRRTLTRTVFVAVTGSAAKTTTKDLIASVLEAAMARGRKSPGTASWPIEIAKLICRTRRSDAYCVSEIGTKEPGFIDLPVALFRPTVAVVTHIGTDHFRAFHSLDAIAEEKGKLVHALPADGIAILNADDARVMAMRTLFPGRIVTYGMASDAKVRATDVAAAWPDRLSLSIHWNGQSARVQTRLCGTHWVSAVLGAVATGVALGVSLDAAARAVAGVEPFEGRMQPVELADGVTFLRDDWKASQWTIASTLEFMRQARVKRKIVVFGTISDYAGDSGRHYVSAASEALNVADCVLFIGAHASSALRAKREADAALRVFSSPRQASDFLADYLRAGDLVLLKGSIPADHLQRLILVRTTDVRCWRLDCRRRHFCDSCDLLHVPSDAASTDAAGRGPAPPRDLMRDLRASPRGRRPVTFVVGLGNPGEQYAATPHNVGQRALHILGQRLVRSRHVDSEGFIMARAEAGGGSICLLEPTVPMNHVGPALRRLAEDEGFCVAECILLHDDVDLPLGAVRTRMRGSDGGHRGVRSILDAFQDDRFRRIKIGVGRPRAGGSALDHVLTSFSAEQLTSIDAACRQAADRVLALAAIDSKPSKADSSLDSWSPGATS